MEEKSEKIENNSLSAQNKIRSIVPWVFAATILIGYGFFMFFLIGKTNSDDKEWVKLSHLLGSIEAIVFTAVGFVFGAEVNRTRAVSAEINVEKIKNEKNELASEILSKIPAAPEIPDQNNQAHDFNYLRKFAIKNLR